jgi:hypothetical protein
MSTSHHHIAPITHHQCNTIPHATNLRHLHGQHCMATHHTKRVPRPNPTPPTCPPNHHIEHTPKFPLHHTHHEQPHILLLRLPQPPATPGHRQDTQHHPTMVLGTTNKYHPHSYDEKHPTPTSKVLPGKRMDGRVAYTCSSLTLQPYTKGASLHSHTPNNTQNHSPDPTSIT